MSKPRTLRVRRTCLSSGSTTSGSSPSDCGDAGRERRGEHVRADGDVGVAAAVEEGVHALQNGLHIAALDLLGEHIVHAQLPRLFEQAHSVAVLLDADGEVVVRRALGPAHVRHLTEHRAGGIAHVVGA